MFSLLEDLNLNSYIDDDLRDKPESITHTEEAISRLIHSLEDIDNNSLNAARILAFTAVLLRRLHQLKQAENFLKSAIDITIIQGKPLQQTAYEIRLAHVYHWKSEFNKADMLFKQLLIRCQQNPDIYSHYYDFVWQHYGKSQFDQGLLNSALNMFRQALSIRQKKGNDELIQSTLLAIEVTQRILCQKESTQPS